MIFLVYGEESFLIDKFVKDEINRNNIEEVCKFDYEKDGLKPVLEECSYIDLFSSSKAIILNNSKFLSSSKKKDDAEYETEEKDNNKLDLKELDKYIDNPNESSYLFIILNEKALDERKSIVKKLNSKVHVRVFNKLRETDALKFIKDYLSNEGITIKPALVSKIIDRVGIDLYSLSNELNKLIMYKVNDENKEVTLEDIENVVSVSLESDIFKLTNSLSQGNTKETLSVYYDLIKLGTHPSQMVSLLANQFRLLYQVKILSREGNSLYDICTILNVKDYPVKLALQNCLNYSEEQLLSILNKLSMIDEDIKSSSVDINSVLENFFLTISTNK